MKLLSELNMMVEVCMIVGDRLWNGCGGSGGVVVMMWVGILWLEMG